MAMPPIAAGRYKFSPKRFRKSVKDYETRSALIYQTLERLCEEHPHHRSEKAIGAKVRIISRTFAAQIERKIRSDGSPGSSLRQLVSHFLVHGVDIDKWIKKIPNGSNHRMDAKAVPAILDVQSRLVNLLREITTNGEQSPRSFVSKYLHFHRPLVPIYDSVASSALKKLVPWQKCFDDGSVDPPGDEKYRRYVMRLWQLNGQAIKAGVDPTVRELDRYLFAETE